MFAVGIYIGAGISLIVCLFFYEVIMRYFRSKRRKARRAVKTNYITVDGVKSYFNEALTDEQIDLAIALLITLDAQDAYKKDQLARANR